ncbi:hypothetical protein OAE19_05255 [Porticoccaceae bacterium]|nr:hypothetical protein [Porticoccaceae bacterium]
MGIIQLPDWAHPDFHSLRSAYSDKLEINTDNPITNKLVGCYVATPAGMFDLVTRKYGNKVGDWHLRQGMAYYDGSGDHEWFDAPVSGLVNWTLGFYGQSLAASADDRFISMGNATGSSSMLGLGTSGGSSIEPRLFFRNNANQSQSVQIADVNVRRAVSGNTVTLGGGFINLYHGTHHSNQTATSLTSDLFPDFFTFAAVKRNTVVAHLKCRISMGWVFDRVLSSAEVKSLHGNPNQLVRPRIPVFFSLPALDGGVLLNIASAVQAASVDNLALVQANTLLVDGADQIQLVDNIELVQDSVIAVDSADQSQAADNVVLSTASLLSIDDAGSTQTVDAVVLIQANILAVLDALHSVAVDSVDLVQANSLAVADADHAHAADNVVLSQGISVAVDDADHAVIVDSVALLQANTLVLSSADQAVTADNVTLELAGVLAVADAVQQSSVDNVLLLQAHTLSISNGLSGQTADNVDLSIAFSLVVDEANQAVSADGIALDTTTFLSILDAAQSVAVDPVALIQSGTLIVSDSLHAALVDAVTLGFGEITIVPGRRTIVVEQAGRSYLVINSGRRIVVD